VSVQPPGAPVSLEGGAAADDREHLERLARELRRRRAPPEPAGLVATTPVEPGGQAQPFADARDDGEAAGTGAAGSGRKAGLAAGSAAAAGLALKFKGALLVLLAKAKFLVGGLKLLQLGKIATTGLSMAVSIWAYGLLFGLPFAVGFVLLIFVHEMGHAAVIYEKGLRAGPPVFIPFVGAAIVLKDHPLDARQEAEIALGGPVAGALAAAACWVLGSWFGSDLLRALAYSGLFLNLFNLLPVPPLDGGRIAAAVSRWLWVAGLAVAVPLALAWRNPILILVVVLGGLRAFRVWRTPEADSPYYAIAPGPRRALALAYFGLAIGLAVGVSILHQPSP
jgi:Zn-dependent protease